MSYLEFLENISVRGGNGKFDIELPRPSIRKVGSSNKKNESKSDNISVKYNAIKNIIDSYISS